MKGSYVVVEGAGCDNEEIVFDSVYFYDTCDFKDENYSEEEIKTLNVDILFQNEKGQLTTDF